jgi:hypothetical protein
MRLKVTSLPPFPPVRVWLLVPSTAVTIRDLKKHIFTSIIRHLDVVDFPTIKSRQVVLSVDGFDLLDMTALEVLKEDTDVIV